MRWRLNPVARFVSPPDASAERCFGVVRTDLAAKVVHLFLHVNEGLRPEPGGSSPRRPTFRERSTLLLRRRNVVAVDDGVLRGLYDLIVFILMGLL